MDIEQARQYYTDNDTAHGFDHVLRVLALAERIARAEGANLEIVRTAALLHDTGRAEEDRTGESHAVVGARLARRILADRPPAFVEAVADAIASHRFRGNGAPESLEARVLFDADKLDSIGAIGVARAYAVGGRSAQRLWSPLDVDADEADAAEYTPVKEFNFKLRRLKDRLFTDTGRALAQERHDFMTAFFERLDHEARGDT